VFDSPLSLHFSGLPPHRSTLYVMSKAEAHEVIVEIHRLASELGHAPTRDEFQAHSRGVTRDRLVKLFGSYSLALQAAGLKHEKPLPKKASELFRAPVPERPIPERPAHTRPAAASQGVKKVLALGDLHFPWANVDALSAVYAYIEAHPDIDAVVQLGDLYDMFAASRFSRSLNTYSPHEEIERGRAMAEAMWAKIRELLPRAQLHQILGNHDIRPLARCIDKAPELEPFIELRRWFEFPGVITNHDSKLPLELAGYTFIHGHLSKLGDHARTYGRSVVCGHSHRGGVVTIPLGSAAIGGPERVITELNAGYLADPTSRPMGYLPTKMNPWTTGFGVIDEWGPRFIPLGGK
jgi:predicted phosphodiesterase